MKALLLVAHGSRRSASNDEVRALALRLTGIASKFDQIHCAFLELAEPSIPDGLQTLINQGASQITVLPYFLAAGRHVIEDIPAEINKVRMTGSNVKIIQADYLGRSEQLGEILLQLAQG